MHRQVLQEGADLGIPQLLRVPVLMEPNKPHDPVQIGLLGADGQPRTRAVALARSRMDPWTSRNLAKGMASAAPQALEGATGCAAS